MQKSRTKLNSCHNFIFRQSSVSLFLVLSILFSFFGFNSKAQISFPTEELNRINKMSHLENFSESSVVSHDYLSGSINQSIIRHQNILNQLSQPKLNTKSTDTLYVGLTPGDSVHFSDAYSYDGTIAVFGDGKLVFEDCYGTINGDIVVYGDDAKLWIINSNLFFPQSFWYQRALIAAGNAEVNITGSTLNYNGLPHDLVIAHDAVVNQTNITNIGFTTCGLSQNATINIDNSNQAGEFVMTSNATGNFANSETVLVWHHIPGSASLDYSFADGESIDNFSFSDSETGVTNIGYSYSITNCTDINWGFMPEPGSNMHITDTKIRTIGIWLKEQPDFTVSGLINNSYYADYSAPLSSHTIELINTEVQTWSIYLFNAAEGNVSNCIVGEIGSMSNSNCIAQNCLIDGSGGYLFATDTSIMTSAFSYLNCNFQTSGNAYGIMAYGGQNMGRCIAFEKSIMFILQANLVEQPEFHDDAMLWYLKIDNASNLYVESLVPIIGSAWIEKASDYYQNDFNWLVAEYQEQGSDEWIACADTVFSEVFSNEICLWNTEGLSQGSYTLRLTMADNTIDENEVEVVKQIVLTENPTSIDDNIRVNDLNIYPNPTKGIINIEADNIAYVSIFSIDGKFVGKHANPSQIYLNNYEDGVYIFVFESNDKDVFRKFVIKNDK